LLASSFVVTDEIVSMVLFQEADESWTVVLSLLAETEEIVAAVLAEVGIGGTKEPSLV